MTMADEGTTNFGQTKFVEYCTAANANGDWKERCEPYLKKYFKGLKFESRSEMEALGDTTNITTDTALCRKLVGKTNKWWYIQDKTKCRGWKNNAVTLVNGARMDFALIQDSYYAGFISSLDVNGSRGPNTWRRDAFYLVILNDGRVVPAYSKDYRDAYAASVGATPTYPPDSYLTSICSEKSTSTTELGEQCAEKIIRDGWEMNY